MMVPSHGATTTGSFRRGLNLASRGELEAFLKGVERRAFKQAVFAVRDDEAALDIVQDAMLRLAEKKGPPPAAAEQLEQSQVLEIIEQELARLPERQRQAFIMRYWEELDVAETAKVMGCSEGSVKTHCSRAAHALAVALKARGITLG